MKPQATDATAVAGGDFQFPAAFGMLQYFAHFGNAAGEHESEAAERVDILLDVAKSRVDFPRDIVQLGGAGG